jgi:hypothetical protein
MVAIRLRTRRQRRHSRAITAARTRLTDIRGEIKELGRAGQPVISKERDEVLAALIDNSRHLAQPTNAGSVPALAPLDLDRWVLWRPAPDDAVGEVRVGTLREGAEGESLGVPCVVPVEPGRALLIVNQTDRQRDAAHGLWLALVTRIAALAAGRSDLVLLDPTRSSADARLFTRVIGGVDVPAGLESLTAATAPSNGRFIAAANVPVGFGPRESALLLAMVRTGAGGSTIVMHIDLEQYRASIGEPDLGTDPYRWVIDVGDTTVLDAGVHASVVWDGAPSAALVDLVVERLASA